MNKMIAGFVSTLITSWLAMLLLGAAHSTDPRVPALGFMTVALLGAAAALAIACGSEATS